MYRRGLVLSLIVCVLVLSLLDVGEIFGVGEDRITVEEVVTYGIIDNEVRQKDVLLDNFKDMGKVDLNHSLSSKTKNKFSVDANVSEGEGILKCDYYYKNGGHIKYCGKEIEEVLMSLDNNKDYIKDSKEDLLSKGHMDAEYGEADYKGFRIEYKYVELESVKHLISVRIQKEEVE